jgi:SPP1 gp7 family putative phage head morphogenesis protein
MGRRTRPPLTKTRQKWAEERGGAVFRGKPLTSASVYEAKYYAQLSRMVERMTRVSRYEIDRLYRSPQAKEEGFAIAMDASFASRAGALLRRLTERFTALFVDKAGGLANALNGGISKVSAEQLGSSLREVSGGVTLKTDVISGVVADVLRASTKQNVALIKSIPAKYFEQIEGAVMRSIQTGRGMADLQPELEKFEGMTKNRAALIARDQTAKATTAINRARMQGLGIRKFEWLHSGGGREPRPLHKNVLNGKVFSLDDPPVIDERTGERGLPGQLINCRCRMVPVIEFTATETTNK